MWNINGACPLDDRIELVELAKLLVGESAIKFVLV